MHHVCTALAAAALPGVPDATSVVEAADDAVLEAAALLAGRPPRGAAQRRFVDARSRAMSEAAAELRERHEAWIAAWTEVDALAPVVPPEQAVPAPSSPGALVSLLVVLLFPAFVGWDIVCVTGRGLAALADGLALRARTAGILAVRAVLAVAALGARARGVWRDLRSALVDAVTEAHRRISSARLHLRLRLRRARRAARGLRI